VARCGRCGLYYHLLSFKAAGPVSRILSVLRRDGHSSGPRIAARL